MASARENARVQLVINLQIRSVPLEVIIALLNHRDCEHESERRYVCDEQPNLEGWEELGTGDKKEV
eukprot:scaffold3437_cov31-Tisochrysis_lutea.AAC.7